MCLGVPAQVLSLPNTGRAYVSVGGVNRLISTDLLTTQPNPGDWVLVHVGFALSMIDADEAATTLQQIRQLGGGTYEDEVESFRSSQIS